MTWTHLGGGGFADGGGPLQTSFSLAPGAAVSAGNTICVAVTYGGVTSVPVTGSSLTDSLGNTYTQKANVTDGTNNQGLDLWECISAFSGTPTFTTQFQPTPGTTATDAVSICADMFSGSGAGSTGDGSTGQLQSAPTTGTDATTSGTISTATDGDLIYTAAIDSSTGNNPGATGTGFTAGQSTTLVVLKTAWKVQTTHGSVAGTWTAAVNDAHITAVMAITPPPAAFATDEGEIWTDVWKAAKPYVPVVTVYS